MDLRFSPEEQVFHAELRGFIRDNLPEEIAARMKDGRASRKEDIVAWQRILNARGWAAYSWPREWGGPGWSEIG
ncbi:MAG: acyl-CoA dehydrogenase family protein, partial [Alphaproteobacteria bacterium]